MFPLAPATNDTHTEGNLDYVYNGNAWVLAPSSSSGGGNTAPLDRRGRLYIHDDGVTWHTHPGYSNDWEMNGQCGNGSIPTFQFFDQGQPIPAGTVLKRTDLTFRVRDANVTDFELFIGLMAATTDSDNQSGFSSAGAITTTELFKGTYSTWTPAQTGNNQHQRSASFDLGDHVATAEMSQLMYAVRGTTNDGAYGFIYTSLLTHVQLP